MSYSFSGWYSKLLNVYFNYGKHATGRATSESFSLDAAPCEASLSAELPGLRRRAVMGVA